MRSASSKGDSLRMRSPLAAAEAASRQAHCPLWGDRSFCEPLSQDNYHRDYEQKNTFWLLWLGFIAYVVFLAPPVQPDTLKLLQNLFTGQWHLINPIVLSIFNLVGIFLLLISQGKRSRFREGMDYLLKLGVRR